MGEILLKNKLGQTEEQFLKAYDPSKFERPSFTVDMLIFTVVNEEKLNYRKLAEKELKMLLIKRGDHPSIGKWALPGGFVEMKEDLDDAAKRELKEETNLENIYMEQLYTFGDVDRDQRTRIISSAYMALVDNSNLKVEAGDDADDARWFSVKCKLFEQQKNLTEKGYVLEKLFKLELKCNEIEISAVLKQTKSVYGRASNNEIEIISQDGIAFDHGKVIHYAIERLRSKIEYTDIAFNLMPEFFTLAELQQVYEVILDKELLKANFRRKIEEMVIETNEYTKDAGHRPSKLYRFNENWTNEKF